MSAAAVPLQLGDSVSVLMHLVYGEFAARLQAHHNDDEEDDWMLVRIDGKIIRQQVGKKRCMVQFHRNSSSALEEVVNLTFTRKQIQFESCVAAGSSSGADQEQEHHHCDSDDAAVASDDDDARSIGSDGAELEAAAEPEDDELNDGGSGEGWERDDHANRSQRATLGVQLYYSPISGSSAISKSKSSSLHTFFYMIGILGPSTIHVEHVVA